MASVNPFVSSNGETSDASATAKAADDRDPWIALRSVPVLAHRSRAYGFVSTFANHWSYQLCVLLDVILFVSLTSTGIDGTGTGTGTDHPAVAVVLVLVTTGLCGIHWTRVDRRLGGQLIRHFEFWYLHVTLLVYIFSAYYGTTGDGTGSSSGSGVIVSLIGFYLLNISVLTLDAVPTVSPAYKLFFLSVVILNALRIFAYGMSTTHSILCVAIH